MQKVILNKNAEIVLMQVQKKNMILSVWNIFFRDGYPSEQQNNTLCKHFMKFTKSKNKHTGWY